MSYEAEINEILDDIGVETIEEAEIRKQDEKLPDGAQERLSGDQVEIENSVITIYESYRPDNPQAETQNIEKSYLLESGDQFKIVVYRRPKCPSCRYIPTQENEPGHLTGECVYCGTQTCPRCKNTCQACGTIMCPKCTDGHGLEDETYCRQHAKQIEEQVEFDRMEERSRRMHQEELEQQEQEAEIRRKQEKLELEKAKARSNQRLEKRERRFKEKKRSWQLRQEDAKLKLRLFEQLLNQKSKMANRDPRTGNEFKSLDHTVEKIKNGGPL